MTCRRSASLCACFILLLLATTCRGEITTLVEHLDNHHATKQFRFDKVPPPSRNDAAADAKFTVLYGALRKGENAHDIDRLHDGEVPEWEDQPLANFAFASGDGGRIRVDLGRAIDLAQVNSYSWHPGTRAAQVYKLYAADGTGPGFDPKPGAGTDPLTCGWTLSVHFDLHNSDKTETTFAHCISFRLYDMTNAKTHWDNPRDQIKVDLLDDGPSSVAAFGLPETWLDLVRPPKATTHITGTIRMVILHNRCEVTLDDKRIFYGPVVADESKRRYAIAIFGVGLSGPVNPPVFEELDDPRAGK